MHRFVRGLVLNRILAAPLMSSPKFHSPVQSKTEMFGWSLSTGGIMVANEMGRETRKMEGPVVGRMEGKLLNLCCF